ncbi:helix-turn-helix domain-containing protein [Paenibacillus eucommiae]|uniref:AraC-like DNA-binding protein n=1 Tax=Paenibacillus eucommiae TaxID=1355755 RepID=A0ABS4J5N0_9BACL|nr:helix-turn-helix domain-containing protein [Paenibacillus eucommiae]MBP1995154.1 AraC-like DNA-binding protein [Paenibacillus eucommiae]
MLPILIISTLLYRNTTSIMQDELRKSNEIYLTQTIENMEMIINQIGTVFQQTVLNGAIKDFEQFPRGSYYETLEGPYSDTDLRDLYTYMFSKSNVQWYLQILKKSNEFIHSVYFYDKAKHIYLTDETQYSMDNFFDDTWSLSTSGIHSYPLINELRDARQRDGTIKQVIPVVYMSPVLGNYIVINLDAEKVYSTIFAKYIRGDNYAFFVRSNSGKLMFYDRQYPVNEAMINDPEFQVHIADLQQNSFEAEILGKQRLITNATSELLGWTFISATAVDQIYESVNNIKNLILLSSLLLIAATGVLVFLTSRHIYYPIQHLLSFIKNKEIAIKDSNPGQKTIGEFKIIRNSLEEAYENQTKLQIRLKESLPANQKMFIHSLLRPNHFTHEEMVERLRYLEIPIAQEELALMVVTVQTDGSGEIDVELSKMNKLHIEDMLEGIIPKERSRIVMELIEDQFVVIMNIEATHMTEIFELADRIVLDTQQLPGIHCTIGIGNHCTAIGDLQRAYEEAKEAQRYRMLSGNSDIIYIRDVTLDQIALLDYPKDKEIALNNYLINGETELAQGMFGEFVKHLQKQNTKVDFRQMQQAFIRLLGSLLETSSALKLDIEKTWYRKENLFEVLLQKNELGDIKAWFEGIIDDFTAYVGRAYTEKNNKYVTQAIRLLEVEFSRNISLTSIADQLQLSPSYFSRIFKEYTGQSFSEYVTALRIEHGKKLLVDSDMRIMDIGERIGYHKTNYFSKVFKESTGLTPGEYRKMHGIQQTPSE